jgi:hypothetical protein
MNPTQMNRTPFRKGGLCPSPLIVFDVRHAQYVQVLVLHQAAARALHKTLFDVSASASHIEKRTSYPTSPPR